MAGFGDRLRAEREARRRTIEQISAATGIHPSYLEALEHEEFHLLPGRAFGKLYIRACAETLGFDPGPLIEEYDRARAAAERGMARPEEPGAPRRVRDAIELWRQAITSERKKARSRALLRSSEAAGGSRSIEAVTPPLEPLAAEPPDARAPEAVLQRDGPPGANPPHDVLADARPGHPVAPGAGLPDDPLPKDAPFAMAPREDARARSSRWAGRGGWMRAATAALVFVGLFGAAATVYVAFLRRAIEASDIAGAMRAEPPPAPAAAPSSAGDAGEVAAPPIEDPSRSARRPRPTAPATTAGPSTLSIAESGVGRRIAQRRLIDPAGSFPEGSVVWFSTRVVGGAPGDRIRHVWIREGRTMQSITLGIGGPDWRTHSRKTVYGAGRWAVEARDDSGRPLARAEFTCGPESF